MGVIRTVSTVAQTAAFGVVLRRLLPGARRLPPLEAPRRTFSDDERVSVVIPARNEGRRIEACLKGLQGQPGLDEVIVVDDESTDETSVIASAYGATVVMGQPLPEGWVGKPWALHQGLRAARNEVVVFFDADVIPRRGLLLALVKALSTNDVISLAPRFRTSSVAEQALHASMLNGLVYRYGAVGVRETSPPERIYGNGQCVAVRRQWLIDEGGFALAARYMNDDIALFQALAARGARVAFRDGRNLVDVRMYTSAREVWREWGRSLPMLDVSTPTARWFDIGLLWLTLIAPIFRVFLRRASVVDYGTIGLRLAMTKAVAPSYEGSRAGVYASPLADIVAVLRLTQATLFPVRSWRGRQYK